MPRVGSSTRRASSRTSSGTLRPASIILATQRLGENQLRRRGHRQEPTPRQNEAGVDPSSKAALPCRLLPGVSTRKTRDLASSTLRGKSRPRMTKPLSREGQVPPGPLVASPRRPPLRPPRRPRVAAPTACRRSLILRSPPASRRANRPFARGRGARQSHDRVARGAACAHCDSACSDCAFPPARATHSRP
jgi:hypothetical protein